MLPVSLSRRRALAVAAVCLGLLALAGRLLIGAGRPDARPQPAAALTPVAAAAPARLTVHVVGEVSRPGLYRLPEGSRVADAVRRAGGPTDAADLQAVNLAAPLADGLQVAIPGRAAGAASTPGGAGPPRKLSLNQATAAELDALPGVGPVTAQRIVDYRAAHGGFRSVDDLDAIPGIGPARVEQVRELVTP